MNAAAANPQRTRREGDANPSLVDAALARPAVLSFTAAALGIVAAHHIPGIDARAAFVVAAALGLTMAALSLARLPATIAGIVGLATIAALAAGWYSIDTHTPGAHDARTFLSEEPTLIRFTGVVADQPRLALRSSGALAPYARFNPQVTRFRIDLESVETDAGNVATTGGLWFRVGGNATNLEPGDVLRGTAWARALPPPANPGSGDIRRWAHPRGIVGSASMDSPDALEIVATRQTPARFFHPIRSRAAATLGLGGATEDSEPRALLRAIVLGDRTSPAYDDLAEAFARTGIGHVLAISGLHVGIIAGAVALLVRLTGDRPYAEAFAVLGAIASMLVLVPPRAPVVRCSIIIAAVIVARLASRRYDPLSVLALVALALLIWRPGDLFDAGFQLSFGVVAALIIFAGDASGVSDRVFARSDSSFGLAGRWLVGASAAALVSWLAATPMTAVHFGQAPLLSVPMTILSVPAVMVMLVLGYAALALSAIFGDLVEPIVSLAVLVAAALAEFVYFADTLPGTVVRLPHMPAWLALAWTVALAALMLTVRTYLRRSRFDVLRAQQRSRWRRWATPSIAVGGSIALVAATAVWLAPERFDRNAPSLSLHTLAVGDGNVHLVRAGGDAILVDCGSTWLGVGQRSVPDAVRALGVRTVRRAIVTHADLDHFSGLPDAARELGLRELLTSQQVLEAARTEPRSLAARAFAMLREQGVTISPINAGDTITFGTGRFATTATVLHPDADATFERDNESSIVIAIEPAVATDAPQPTLLLTGDAEGSALAAIERFDFAPGPIVADAPHHGAENADALDTMLALEPIVVIQSTGPRRVNNELWQPLRERTTWLTTATDGAITVRFHRDGSIEHETFRPTR